MRFEFATANRILFGSGVLQEIPALAAGMGRRALVITGQSVTRATEVIEGLADVGLGVTVFHVELEPTTDRVRVGVTAGREAGCDVVIGIGGGSVLDTGKAIAALLTNSGDVFDYLEVIGRAQPLPESPLPYIAAPSTAGTGTEVTRNAVLLSPEHRVKVSLRSPLMLPRLAVIDPELTYSMPPIVTASTGLDALTQVMEPFVSNRANPLTDAVCREGLARVARSLRRAFTDGDPAAREDMCAGESVRWAGFGERQAGRGAWLRRAAGRDVSRAAWGGLRSAAALRDGDQCAGAPLPRAGRSGPGPL